MRRPHVPSPPSVTSWRWIASLTAVLACGPTPDGGSTDAGSSDTEGEATTVGEASDSGSTGGSTGGGLPGIAVEDAAHTYTCIDGCEGYYSSDWLYLDLLADEARDVEVAWHDWTISDRALVLTPAPIVQSVHLEAGVVTKVTFEETRDGFCSMEEWSAPMRALITIDDVELEIDGNSNASFGWDC